MAERNYLVEGLSGTGKSTVYDALVLRGHWAVSTDRAWKRAPSTWDEQRAVAELERPEPRVLFVCGSSSNRDRFLPYFSKVLNLRVDDETMERRLAERTNNDYGKDLDELELMLALNRRDAKAAGAVDVDATRPVAEVVDDVLRFAGSPAPEPRPWSRLGEPPAYASVGARRIEFAWSTRVLTALLSYLEAIGIDLALPRVTEEHRVRHLAQLDPTAFDPAALRGHYERLNATEAAGVDYAMLDGVAFLRDTLEALEPGLAAAIVL